jgi:N-acetylglucosamine kinase-like BadF-type ATPase
VVNVASANQEAVFLGIDGGGTKTALCIVDRRGARLATAQAPSIYYFGTGISLVKGVLDAAVPAVCAQAGIAPVDIDYAFVGFPGYGEASADTPQLDAIPADVLGHDRYACGNDMVCGWAGSLAARDGINVVSGTGSVAYGQRAGRDARAGGWSELFGDEGSAYWIGSRGLAAFAQMSDGRREEGPLRDVMREHLDLTSDLDAIDVVLNRWGGRRREVASLSTIVVQAASRGDERAAEILAGAGRELARLVAAVDTRLGFSGDERTCVSYSGSVFGADAVRVSFTEAMSALEGSYEVRPPLLDPVAGAALYAAKKAGMPLDTDAIDALRDRASDDHRPR